MKKLIPSLLFIGTISLIYYYGFHLIALTIIIIAHIGLVCAFYSIQSDAVYSDKERALFARGHHAADAVLGQLRTRSESGEDLEIDQLIESANAHSKGKKLSPFLGAELYDGFRLSHWEPTDIERLAHVLNSLTTTQRCANLLSDEFYSDEIYNLIYRLKQKGLN